MPTRRVSPETPEQDVIDEAAAHLRAGRLVAFPTETVYGLGADAMDPRAVSAIFAAKGRPSTNPLIVHLADAGAVHRVASEWNDVASALAAAFWPGPLTLVVPKRSAVPDTVTAGLDSVAVRVPAHPVAHALLVAADIPVAAPSANRSTETSPTLAVHVERALGDRVAMILDGGPARVGIESTVLDVTGRRPLLLRPGTIARTAIEAVAGPIDVLGGDPGDAAPRASPGLMARHYAPHARLALFGPDTAAAALALLTEARARGERTGALLRSAAGTGMRAASDVVVELPDDPAAYAQGLYAALHELDARGCRVVAAEAPPPGDRWDGVRDRLRRAATP